MFIQMRTVPQAQDARLVVACIRACVWATVEGRPFCPFNKSESSDSLPDFPPTGLKVNDAATCLH